MERDQASAFIIAIQPWRLQAQSPTPQRHKKRRVNAPVLRGGDPLALPPLPGSPCAAWTLPARRRAGGLHAAGEARAGGGVPRRAPDRLTRKPRAALSRPAGARSPHKNPADLPECGRALHRFFVTEVEAPGPGGVHRRPEPARRAQPRALPPDGVSKGFAGFERRRLRCGDGQGFTRHDRRTARRARPLPMPKRNRP